MKTILVSILLLAFIAGISQDCKFNKTEILDELSGLPVLAQKNPKNINRPGSIAVEFSYSTNRCWILLHISIERGGLAQEMTFNTRTPIVFTFSDSSFLQLNPSREYFLAGSSNISSTTLFYGLSGMIASTQTFHVFYDISKENVEMLASKEVERIRLNYSPPNFGGNIMDSSKIVVKYKENRPSSYGKKHIQNSSKCILAVDFKDPDFCRAHDPTITLNNKKKKSDEELLVGKADPGNGTSVTADENFHNIKKINMQ